MSDPVMESLSRTLPKRGTVAANDADVKAEKEISAIASRTQEGHASIGRILQEIPEAAQYLTGITSGSPDEYVTRLTGELKRLEGLTNGNALKDEKLIEAYSKRAMVQVALNLAKAVKACGPDNIPFIPPPEGLRTALTNIRRQESSQLFAYKTWSQEIASRASMEGVKI